VRRLLVVILGFAGVAGLVVVWMRCTRIGAGLANDVVNPWLVAHRASGSGASELATLEHVGRRSGIRRLTPLHAIPTDDGVRFAVPLGDRSEWARNVVAAGRCRMQYHDMVVDLDAPRLLAPVEDSAMGPISARITGWLGWKYLTLHRIGEQPGSLEPGDATR